MVGRGAAGCVATGLELQRSAHGSNLVARLDSRG